MPGPQASLDPHGGARDLGALVPRKRRDPAGRGQPLESRRVLGMRVDVTSYEECAEAVLELAGAGSGGIVCVATAHMAMETFDDPELRRIVNAAERVTPDGMSLVWALRRLGARGVSRVYGPDLLPEICARAAQRGVRVGLYGGEEGVVLRLRTRLLERFPRLEIPFAWSPPFRELEPEEDARATAAIEDAGVGVLFVGLGCPRQERWMAAHREALPCVLVGVGAAFDFLSGAKPQAPRWVMAAGLEWLFRLLHEPRRLWRRYLVGNARFLFHFLVRRNPDPWPSRLVFW
jgi:N-acetylglucosaminyldiphosphoundecaprenol N-acetyl-beta-D-mannosaminyltransferase